MTAPNTYEPTVEDLRRQSERNRAELKRTITELQSSVSDTASDIKERISPSHIKAEINSYVRESRDNLAANLERRARENPLQALAIGVGVAYPLWGLIRAIPVPILMVGAGLLLSKQTQRASDKLAQAGDAASAMADKAGSAASSMASQARDRLDDSTSAARRTLHDARDRIAEVTETAGAQVKSYADKVTSTVSDAQRRATQAGQDFVAASTDRAAAGLQATQDAVASARDSVVDFGARSKAAALDVVDQNPLLVAGIGVAVGALVAASLPASDAENRLLGSTKEKLKAQAQKAAADGLQSVSDAAVGLVAEVAEAATREGVSLDRAKAAVSGLIDSANTVVDRGLNAALGEKPNASGQSTYSPSQHD